MVIIFICTSILILTFGVREGVYEDYCWNKSFSVKDNTQMLPANDEEKKQGLGEVTPGYRALEECDKNYNETDGFKFEFHLK